MYYIDNEAKSLNLSPEYRHAIAYHNAGYNIIPIREWRPIVKWTEYQKEKFPFWPNFGMFSGGFAVLCGSTSGNLEVLDFDEKNNEGQPVFLTVWKALAPELQAKLCVVSTPSGGFHIYYRLPESFKSQPHLCDNSEGLPLIEQRCERLYVVGIGCLKQGKRYKQLCGDFKSLSVLTLDERQSILDQCKALNRYHRPEKEPDGRDEWDRLTIQGLKLAMLGESIFDTFNKVADWDNILEPLGWQIVDRQAGVTYWRRPGYTTNQLSATSNHNGFDKLYVYSESTTLPSRKYLSKAQVFCTLACKGDWKECAQKIEKSLEESE